MPWAWVLHLWVENFNPCLLVHTDDLTLTHTYGPHALLGGEVTALTNAVCAEPCVNKVLPKIWNIVPNFPETFSKNTQNFQNFKLITSCLLENFPSLPIPGRIFRFPEKFCFSLNQPWSCPCYWKIWVFAATSDEHQIVFVNFQKVLRHFWMWAMQFHKSWWKLHALICIRKSWLLYIWLSLNCSVLVICLFWFRWSYSARNIGDHGWSQCW